VEIGRALGEKKINEKIDKTLTRAKDPFNSSNIPKV